MQATGYSLWLMPTGPVFTELAGVIADLAAAYGGPRFDPHITLLGEIPMTGPQAHSVVRTLPGIVRPFTVRLTALEGEEAYFRSLFVRVEETAALRHASMEARRRFRREDAPPFIPHLSLLYGDYPQAVKDEVIARLGPRLERSFPIAAVQLVDTQGAPEDWHIVRTVPLY